MVNFDKHIFLESVSNFELPSTFSYKYLENALNEYPAFNSLQLINAVLTNKENPALFKKNLSQIATKVIDRAVLHDYIFKNKFTWKKPETKKEVLVFNPPINERKETTNHTINENQLKEETIQEIDLPDSIKSKTEERDLAFQNLSDELFKAKIEKSNGLITEKERKRIEEMKKLQNDLFNKTKEKEPLAVKKSKNQIIEKSITPKIIGPIKDIQKAKENALTSEETKKLSPLEKIRLAKANKIKNTPNEKAISLIARLKQQQKTVVKDKTKEESETQKISPLEKIKLANAKKNNSSKEKAKNLIARLKEQQKSVIKENLTASFQKNEKSKEISNENNASEKNTKKPITEQKNKEKETTQLEKSGRVIANKKNESVISNKEKIHPIINKSKTLEDSSINKPSNINEFLKTKQIGREEEKEEKKTFKGLTPFVEDSEFLKWLKEKNGKQTKKTPSNQIETKEKVEIITPKKIIKEIIVEAKIEEKEDLIPFEKASGIEHEMHQEIKKSSDPLDDFISNQIAKKKGVRKKTVSKKTSNIGLISETLAEILIIQQKYTEAIEVYNTLSLKYPEKSIYFANQIKKIKNYQ